MRTYDIPYVKQTPSNYYPPRDLNKMSFEEIEKVYLNVCAKYNHDISNCSKCQAPCTYGKRAIQLKANEIYNQPTIPLYGDKTLIEAAREANMKAKMGLPVEPPKKTGFISQAELDKRNAKKAEAPNVETPKETKRRARKVVDDWYDKAYNSKDPLQWIMDTFEITKAKAKQKVYSYQNQHPELKETKPLWEPNKKKSEAAKHSWDGRKPKEEMKEEPKPEVKSNKAMDSFEEKLNALMAKADEYKKLADEHRKKAEEYQKMYDEAKSKVDTVFAAINILDE